jgi:integrase/recombinase XerD
MADFVSKAVRKSIAFIRLSFPKGGEDLRMAHSLYDERGRRKYLVPMERKTFLKAALNVGGETASFCVVMVFCGTRISEALAITPERIDDANCTINVITLKQRIPKVRAIPVPRKLLYYLDGVHHYRDAQRDPERARARLWRFSRTTAWRRIKFVMRHAAHPEFVSQPKSLRHAFGAEASMHVALPMVQKWLGHASIKTTAIYTTLVGNEERAVARKTWRRLTNILKSPRR